MNPSKGPKTSILHPAFEIAVREDPRLMRGTTCSTGNRTESIHRIWNRSSDLGLYKPASEAPNPLWPQAGSAETAAVVLAATPTIHRMRQMTWEKCRGMCVPGSVEQLGVLLGFLGLQFGASSAIEVLGRLSAPSQKNIARPI